MSDNKFYISMLVITCLTVCFIVCVISSCTRDGEREFTKRQLIVSENGRTNRVLERYDPIYPGGGPNTNPAK